MENHQSDSNVLLCNDENHNLVHTSKAKASKSIKEILRDFSEDEKIKLIKEFEEQKINKSDFFKIAY